MLSAPWKLVAGEKTFLFGTRATGFSFPTAPKIGSRSPDIADFDLPTDDGVVFSTDLFRGSTITFDIDVLGTTYSDVLKRRQIHAQAWRGDAVRRTAGAVAELHAATGRMTFGRPRRYSSDDELLPYGKVRTTCDFAATTDLWFSGTEAAASVSLVPEAGGGLVAPLAAPLATTASSDRSRVFEVGGEAATWPVFEIEGPITNPVIEIVGLLRMEFRLTLAYDQTLVVDTRPHARTILRNGGNAAGTTARGSTRLSRAALPPGRHELVLRGTSSSGTARATARWRDAFPTY
jgi:hypothetical protein